MNRLYVAGGSILFLCQIVSATISNWVFDNSTPYLPTDSLSYSYTSNLDTTLSRIYLETGEDTSGLDTNRDMLLFTIMMIDNNTIEKWGENHGLMADGNPDDGAYLFNPGSAGLAPGLYIAALSDRDAMLIDTFRVIGFPDLYRTASGIVTPPQGVPAAFLSIACSSVNLDYTLSAWTDAKGAFTLGIDQATIDRAGGKMTARVESRFHEFIAAPTEYLLDFTSNNWLAVDFNFVKATAVVRGTVRTENGRLENVVLVLQNPDRTPVTSTTSTTDGTYELFCPPGTYIVSVDSFSGAKKYLPPPEIKIVVGEGDTATADIALQITDLPRHTNQDTLLQPGADESGNGVVILTIIDSTNAMIEKGTIMVFDRVPVDGEQTLPLRTFSLDNIRTPLLCNGIPARKIVVAVELYGKVLDQNCRYFSIVRDNQGNPSFLDFGSTDTVHATVPVFEKDCRAGDGSVIVKKGNGSVSGNVTCRGNFSAATTVVLLYDVATGSWVRSVPLREDCTYTISHISAGNYRVVAIIERNGDKNPEAIAISDSLLVFSDAEIYAAIDIAFAEKPTGTGTIAGTLSGIDRLPAGIVVTVAAIPIDTALPESEQLNEMTYMMAYRSTVQSSGTFTIGDLPDGVYNVVAVAEVKADAADSMREVAYGVYGELLLAGEDALSFGPSRVVVKQGTIVNDISIIMMMRQENDRAQIVSAEKLNIPPTFALQSSRLDRPSGRVCLQFAVPENAGIAFSLIDLGGRTIAEMPQKNFSPGYHTVNWKIATEKRGAIADGTYIVSMKSTRYRAEHIVKIVH